MGGRIRFCFIPSTGCTCRQKAGHRRRSLSLLEFLRLQGNLEFLTLHENKRNSLLGEKNSSHHTILPSRRDAGLSLRVAEDLSASEYIKDHIYLNWGEKYKGITDHIKYTHNLSSCEVKA